LKHIKHQWRTYGGTPRGVPSHRDIRLPHIEVRASHRKSGALRPILCAEIRPSISTKNLIPEEVNYTKITIRVTVMNKVQFLPASEPRKPLKPRSLYVIFLVEKGMRVKRRRACDYRDHKKI
jgi:hypothetical protein